MKKIYSVLAMGAVAFGMNAAVDMPIYLQQNFQEAFDNQQWPEGWITIGQDIKPVGKLASEFFPQYSATDCYSLASNGVNVLAFSPSEFEGEAPSNEWLITPAFTITDKSNMLTYTVGAYGNKITNKYQVYISEGGTAKEDFTPLTDSGVKGDVKVVNLANRRFMMEGYEGKTVRLAFVNEGNTSGMMGFTDIQVAPYYLEIKNLSSFDALVLSDNQKKVGMTLTLTTPEKCTGFTAKLTTSTGFESTFVSKTKFSSTKAKTETFEFPEEVDLNGAKAADYTITITPNYDGAPTTTLTGRIVFAEMKYNKVAVMEELTGTWCGYCPYGYSLMNYVVDKYNGQEGNPLAIGVAVHNDDPMAISYIDSGITAVGKPLGFNGYPSMIINRETALHPAESLDYIDNLLKEKTYASVKINKVDYNEDSQEVTMNYGLTLGYDSENCGLKAMVITTQNNMTGKGPKWSQANNLAGMPAGQISGAFGEDAVPYFEMFIGDASNSVSGLLYPDVAREYYPSVTGDLIEGSFVNDVATDIEVKFPMSKNVTKLEDAVLTVVILNSAGEIVTADHVGYNGFEITAVDGIENGSISVRAQQGKVAVNAPAAGIVTVFSADGRVVAKADVAEGLNFIDAPRGISIVRVEAGSESKTVKVIVK